MADLNSWEGNLQPEPECPTKKVTPTRRAIPANLQPPPVSAGRDPPSRAQSPNGKRTPSETRNHSQSRFLSRAPSQTGMIRKPTLPPLRPSHLEKGPHHLLPSWRSPSLSWLTGLCHGGGRGQETGAEQKLGSVPPGQPSTATPWPQVL